jgi:hypothetical protein
MESVNKSRDERQDGLWLSCRDFIIHALEHFSSARQANETFHDRKWAILSVAHAAEAYCNLLLCVFDPNHPKGDYPSLNKARSLLKDHPRLISSEQHVIQNVLSPLADQRNKLMHMPAPEILTVTDTAIALLSLLHIIRRRTGVDTREFFDQSPPVEQDIFEGIEWREHDKWFGVAEQLVTREYGEACVVGCDYCGAIAVPPDSLCQACFQPASRSSE